MGELKHYRPTDSLSGFVGKAVSPAMHPHIHTSKSSTALALLPRASNEILIVLQDLLQAYSSIPGAGGGSFFSLPRFGH